MQRGLLGGTFDPIHYGHLFMGEVAYRQLDIESVSFLPAGAPWQKSDLLVSDCRHRLEMTRLATADIDYFDVDDREVRHRGWTYTIDTIESYDTTDNLSLVLGADTAAGIRSWKRWEDILDLVRIAVLPRPGVELAALDAALGDSYLLMDAPPLSISGTAIRRRVATKTGVRFLTPDAVIEYFTDHLLYGSP